MKKAIERRFIRLMRANQPMAKDEVVSLWPREYYPRLTRLDGASTMIFDIVDRESCRISGEIALRFGEGKSLFYLGHVGYHIDPPFRGKNEALRACRLCIPIFAAMGMRSFVITTDVTNMPSIRTCEKLGCVLESTVQVPGWCRAVFELDKQKRRYVYK